MDKDNFLSSIKNILEDEKKKKLLLIILLSVGLFLMCISLFFPSSSDTSNKTNTKDGLSVNEYKTSLEKSITDTLKDVDGVGEVKVTITLDGEGQKDIAYNQSSSSSTSNDNSSSVGTNETTSKEAVMVRDGSSETPYETKESYPAVVGVVVVASGANSKTVQYYITKSVEALLDLPSYKIVVLPRE